METLIIERLLEEEIIQIKGGRWVIVEGVWYWVETYDLPRGDEG